MVNDKNDDWEVVPPDDWEKVPVNTREHEEWKANPERKFTPDSEADPSLLSELGKSAGAFGRGVNRMIPAADEIAGVPAGIVEAAKGGSFKEGYKMAADSIREDTEKDVEEYPAASYAGSGAALGGIGGLTAGLGVPAMIGASGALGVLSDDTADAGERAAAGLRGGALGAAGVAAGKGLAAVGKAVTGPLTRSVVNFPRHVRTALEERMGSDYLKYISDLAEKYGVGNKAFQGTQGMAKGVEGLSSKIGQRIADNLDDVTLPGARITTKGMTTVFDDVTDSALRSSDYLKSTYGNSAGADVSKQITEQYNRLMGPEKINAKNMWEFAKKLDNLADTFGNSMDAVSGDKARLYSEVARQIRQKLMERAPTNALRQAMTEYAEMAPLRSATSEMLVSAGAPLKSSTIGPKLFATTKPVLTTINSVFGAASKYGEMFSKAAAAGTSAVNALYYSLMQRDPEFNKKMLEAKTGDE